MKKSKLQDLPKKIKKYFLEVKSEMKKVVWPTRQETLRYTATVIAISFVVAIFLGGIDYLLNIGLKQLISLS